MSFQKLRGYLPLRLQEAEDSTEAVEKIGLILSKNSDPERRAYHPRSTIRTTLVIWLPWSLFILLFIFNLYVWTKAKITKHYEIWSPAEASLSQKNVVWTSGIGAEITPYQGEPTEEREDLWRNLYNFAVSRIPMSDAVKLNNRTTPIPNEPGNYVVILDVFHQLHCLNMIRQRIYWDSYLPYPEDVNMVHISHCIDNIRQSLMCSADITPISYAWYPERKETFPTTGMMHTCRDFDAIQEWAREREQPVFDRTIHVQDPLGNVIYYE